jgi:hypothetical protein
VWHECCKGRPREGNANMTMPLMCKQIKGDEQWEESSQRQISRKLSRANLNFFYGLKNYFMNNHTVVKNASLK